jgi:hypothetical protein
MLEQFLPPYDIEMPFDLWIFFSEAVDFFLRKGAAEAGVEFAGKRENNQS